MKRPLAGPSTHPRPPGFFLLRRSAWSAELLNAALQLSAPLHMHSLWEQAAIHWLLFDGPASAERARHVRYVPQAWVNSYPLPLAAFLASPAPDEEVRLLGSRGLDGVRQDGMTPGHAWFMPELGDGFVAFSGCDRLAGKAACREMLDAYFNLTMQVFEQERCHDAQGRPGRA